LRGRVLGSPALVGPHLYVGGEGAGGDQPGALFAIDRARGEVVWRFGVGRTVWSSPTVVGDSLWFGAHDGLVRRLTDRGPQRQQPSSR
ncbi:MAG: PQQ-binding-like beta-propeller repeat protein, partial [Planctomycetes bacterium]|nr:PQQ-binding-like beta-propeller repeat protein [Planctomycetota bacterium]